jgi:hypothetical protein
LRFLKLSTFNFQKLTQEQKFESKHDEINDKTSKMGLGDNPAHALGGPTSVSASQTQTSQVKTQEKKDEAPSKEGPGRPPDSEELKAAKATKRECSSILAEAKKKVDGLKDKGVAEDSQEMGEAQKALKKAQKTFDDAELKVKQIEFKDKAARDAAKDAAKIAGKASKPSSAIHTQPQQDPKPQPNVAVTKAELEWKNADDLYHKRQSDHAALPDYHPDKKLLHEKCMEALQNVENAKQNLEDSKAISACFEANSGLVSAASADPIKAKPVVKKLVEHFEGGNAKQPHPPATAEKAKPERKSVEVITVVPVNNNNTESKEDDKTTVPSQVIQTPMKIEAAKQDESTTDVDKMDVEEEKAEEQHKASANPIQTTSDAAPGFESPTKRTSETSDESDDSSSDFEISEDLTDSEMKFKVVTDLLFNVAKTLNLRKKGPMVYKPVNDYYHEDYYKEENMNKTPREKKGMSHFCDEQFQDPEGPYFSLYHCGNSRRNQLISYLTKRTALKSFPDLEVDYNWICFKNCVFSLKDVRYYEFGDERLKQLNGKSCGNFINLDIPESYLKENDTIHPMNYINVGCPLFFEVVKAQIPNETERFVFLAFLGRLFYRVKEYDDFQRILFLKGESGTGKSLLNDLLTEIFGSHNVTAFNPDDKKYALANAVKYRVVLCPDLTNDVSGMIHDSDFKSMVTGDTLRPRGMRQEAYDVKWTTPVMFTSNSFPNFTARSAADVDAYCRRILFINFGNKIENRDKTLFTKIKERELGFILPLLTRCYKDLRDQLDQRKISSFDDYLDKEPGLARCKEMTVAFRLELQGRQRTQAHRMTVADKLGLFFRDCKAFGNQDGHDYFVVDDSWMETVDNVNKAMNIWFRERNPDEPDVIFTVNPTIESILTNVGFKSKDNVKCCKFCWKRRNLFEKSESCCIQWKTSTQKNKTSARRFILNIRLKPMQANGEETDQ